MTRDEILSNPDYLMACITRHLYRRKDGDLERAKFFLDKLIEHEAKDDVVDIDLLDEFDDCLLGCVYEADGNPVPVYDSVHMRDTLTSQGMSEDDAHDYIESLAEGMKIMCVHDINFVE